MLKLFPAFVLGALCWAALSGIVTAPASTGRLYTIDDLKRMMTAVYAPACEYHKGIAAWSRQGLKTDGPWPVLVQCQDGKGGLVSFHVSR